jgi:hypothetical protein
MAKTRFFSACRTHRTMEDAHSQGESVTLAPTTVNKT